MLKMILIGLGSIAMLIGGIFIMRHGLNKLFGNKLKKILQHMTKTPVHGLITGIAAAMIMQSSTAVSLLTIGLVSANYLSFYQGLGIILGANIGTCSTVQLMTLSISETTLWLLLILSAIGSILCKKLRYPCLALTGLFSMFTGLTILSDLLSTLQHIDTLLYYLALAKSLPIYGIAGGIMLTLLFQSSSAATGVLMVLAGEGLIDVTTAAYVIYGNNIGACLSSIIISIAAPLAARRIALSHLLLNLLGVILFMPFTSLFIKTTSFITNDFGSQIALVHTLFNVISSLVILPFIRQYANLILFFIPEKR